MPIYEYHCPRCERTFEAIHFRANADTAWATCPECKGPAPKIASAATPHFKGTGFYATDYKRTDKPSYE